MRQHAANKHVVKPAAFHSPLRQDSCAGDKPAASRLLGGGDCQQLWQRHFSMYRTTELMCNNGGCRQVVRGWRSAGGKQRSMPGQQWLPANLASPLSPPWKLAPSPLLGTLPQPCANSHWQGKGTSSLSFNSSLASTSAVCI